ncbi:hypothetical protein Drorol1_Dr00016795 [Drosera rotundifolia]
MTNSDPNITNRAFQNLVAQWVLQVIKLILSLFPLKLFQAQCVTSMTLSSTLPDRPNNLKRAQLFSIPQLGFFSSRAPFNYSNLFFYQLNRLNARLGPWNQAHSHKFLSFGPEMPAQIYDTMIRPKRGGTKLVNPA